MNRRSESEQPVAEIRAVASNVLKGGQRVVGPKFRRECAAETRSREYRENTAESFTTSVRWFSRKGNAQQRSEL